MSYLIRFALAVATWTAAALIIKPAETSTWIATNIAGSAGSGAVALTKIQDIPAVLCVAIFAFFGAGTCIGCVPIGLDHQARAEIASVIIGGFVGMILGGIITRPHLRNFPLIPRTLVNENQPADSPEDASSMESQDT